jgi:general secretion pathway protein D
VFSDPRLADGAIGGSTNVDFNRLFGGAFAVGGNTFGQNLPHANLNVSALLQLLMRKYHLTILLEPKLYTADNQEAEFFDGQDVPYQKQSQSSPEGTSLTRTFDYTAVGNRLRIRPHITQEGDVDLTVNLEISRIVPGETTLGNFLFDRRETTTHVILHDGQTVMLSGIVHQEESNDVRKLPLLGDIPLVGPALFRSTDKAKYNRELIAFITPRVVRRGAEQAGTSSYTQWLEGLRRDVGPPVHDTPPAADPSTQPADAQGAEK